MGAERKSLEVYKAKLLEKIDEADRANVGGDDAVADFWAKNATTTEDHANRDNGGDVLAGESNHGGGRKKEGERILAGNSDDEEDLVE